MAAFQKFHQFVQDFANGVHDLHGTEHTLKLYLSNTAPDAAADAVKADLAEIATGNGYAGPIDIQNDGTASLGTLTVTAVDLTITAAGGSIGPFRYVVIYNDTPTSPADPLIGWYDYGSAITLTDGKTLLVDFGASLLTIQDTRS